MIVWTHQLYSCHNTAAGCWLSRTYTTLFVSRLQQAQYKQEYVQMRSTAETGKDGSFAHTAAAAVVER